MAVLELASGELAKYRKRDSSREPTGRAVAMAWLASRLRSNHKRSSKTMELDAAER